MQANIHPSWRIIDAVLRMTNPGRVARKIEQLQRNPTTGGPRRRKQTLARPVRKKLEPTVLLATVSYLTYKVSGTATCI
jgi:hypothetical protein